MSSFDNSTKSLPSTHHKTFPTLKAFLRGALCSLALLMMAAPASALTQKEVFCSAKWIGPDSDHLTFYPYAQTVFSLQWVASPLENSWVRFGAGDQRLEDMFKNIWHMEAKPGESYIEAAVHPKDGTIEIERKNMGPKDEKGILDFPAELREKLSQKNAGELDIRLDVLYGYTEVFVDNVLIGTLNLNPVIGNMSSIKLTGDYIAFPILGDVAWSDNVRDISVFNVRSPKNLLARLDIVDDPFGDMSDPYGTLGSSKKSKSSNKSKGNTYDKGAAGTSKDAPQPSQAQLRQKFTINGTPKEVKLRITARGIYDLFVNGRLIDAVGYFHPGFTQYDKSHNYQEYNLTPWVNPGENTLQVQLYQGWWTGPSTYSPEGWNQFSDRESMIALLKIDNNLIPSDPTTWEYSVDGPVRYASFFQGQVKDGRIKAFSDDSKWYPAVEIPTDGTTVEGYDFTQTNFFPQKDFPVHVSNMVQAKSMKEVRDGVYIYDMGQNMAAVPMVQLRNMNPGEVITLRFAEELYPELPQFGSLQGELLSENIRAAMATDQYICSGEPLEIFSPRGTFHGYRYMELSGTKNPPRVEDVTALALSSVKDLTANYKCSDEDVNQLWKNILWSTKSNFLSIPTDCPQRNERMGWNGDINVYSHTATYITDAREFLIKHLRAMRDTQKANGRFADVSPMYNQGFGGLLWGSAGIELPWQLYLQYGETDALREHYPAMERYMEYIRQNCIDPQTGILKQTYPKWGDLGDWLSPEDDKNDPSLLWEAYYIHDLDLMSRMAQVLGMNDKAQQYNSERQKRVNHFINTYFDGSGKTVWSGLDPQKKGTPVGTLTSYVLPIAFDIVEVGQPLGDKVVKNLTDKVTGDNYKLNVGFIGVPWVAETLSSVGRDDLAYKMVTNREFPSWLYSVEQGATTIWERLNSYVEGEGFPAGNGMNSFNHYSFGSVGSWLIERSLGIQRDENAPGFDHFFISPSVDPTGNITWAQGWYESYNGKIRSSWKKNPNGTITYEFTIPEGTTATVMLKGMKEPKLYQAGDHTVTL